MKSKLSVIIVDDDRASTHFLYEELKKISHISIDWALNGKELIELLAKRKYDIVILDYLMPVMDGLEATGIIKEKFPETKILFHTAISDPEIARLILNAGINGWLWKDFKCHDAKRALEVVLDDRHFLSEEVRKIIMDEDSSVIHNRVLKEEDKLSERELQVMLMVIAGLTAKEIEKKLSISQKTVSKHIEHIHDKTRESTVYGLIRYAFMYSIIPSASFFTSDKEKEKIITHYYVSPIRTNPEKKIRRNT